MDNACSNCRESFGLQKLSPAIQLREALIEFAAGFPVYRTYVRAVDNVVGESDFYFIKQVMLQSERIAGADLCAGTF